MIKKQKKRPVKKSTWIIGFFTSFILLYVLSLFTPLVSGYAAFPLAVIKCGGKEPYISSDFAAGYSYSAPGDGFYNGPDILTSPGDYHCTKDEVEKAGYRPYLWGNERCRYFKHNGRTSCADGGSGYAAMIPYAATLLVVSVLMTFVTVRFPLKRTMSATKKILNRKV